jgi:general secretion pathway protein I
MNCRSDRLNDVSGNDLLWHLHSFVLLGRRLLQRLVRRSTSPAREAGFTLVEVIVALAILSTSLSVLLGIVSTGLLRTSSAERMAEAGSLAQSLLAEVGTRYPIGPGERSGEYADGYHWRLNLQPVGSDTEWEQRSVGLYEVSADIEWEDGEDRRSFRLNTLRIGVRAPQR